MTFARVGTRLLSRFAFVILATLHPVLAPSANAQTPQQRAGVVSVARGASELLVQPAPVARVSIGDPEVADAVAISPREVLVNGRALGTTSLIIWDASGNRRFYSVEVTADAPALQRQLATLFPGERIAVTASGNTIVLSGSVSDVGISRRALQIAQGTGATVIDNLTVPAGRQVLLQVRFAEVSRTAALRFSSHLRALNADKFEGIDTWSAETLSDGLVSLFFAGGPAEFSAAFSALRSDGSFKSLAEPNLLAMEGQEASFLAGGEFPFPIPQSGQSNTITIAFREFGVRLRFIPTITIAGDIQLEVAPEVSSLDFTNGLRIQGFDIPSLITRRAETTVVLKEGQTFAIAGLLDNTIANNTSRIPLLGDLPIVGVFFRNRDKRQERRELLVLVTPRLVQPLNAQPPVPTGEPATWEWSRKMRPEVVTPPATPPAPAQPRS
jgi:pilus assembly protein CpaC